MADTSGYRRDNTLQLRLMDSRRWSSPHFSTPWNLYSHYVDGVNENERVLRMHRKRLVKTADSKSRAQRRGAHKAAARRTSSAQQLLEWSKEKFRDRLRKRQKMLREAAAAEEHGSPNTTLSRKVTSRMSDRKKSRESMALVNNQDVLSSSDQEEEKEEKAITIRTFWWYCKVVKAICKLCLDMQKLSMRKTQQTTLSELYYVSISGARAPEDEDKDGQILFFDKTLFARKRACSHVPEWAQSIMITRPELRRPEDILRLKHLLMGMRSFREKFNEQMRTKICQVVRYTKCDKGRVILRQGHYGQDFYFIFSGSVFIQIDLVDQQTGDRIPSTENIIRSGESFGELALLGDGLRSASVICREPTELCQIDKTTFLNICPALFNEQLEEKIEFAKHFELFDSWDPEQLRQLCFLSQVLYIPHGRILELNWATAQYVYFVMKGRISLIKEFDVKEVLADDGWTPGSYGEQEEEEIDIIESDVASRKRLVAKRSSEKSGMKIKSSRHTRFACVGTLRSKQATDLRLLSLKPPQLPSITLLSEGACVLRVALRNFDRFAPRRQAEEYLKRHYVPISIPTARALVTRYVHDVNWSTYRKCVITTLARERTGELLASMAATSKGTTGWARWPGFDPDADVKSGWLSERGAKSKTDEFPIVKLTRHHTFQRGAADGLHQTKAQDVLKRKVLKVPEVAVSRSTGGISATIKNDRTLILYPPVLRTPTSLRMSLIKEDGLMSKT